MEVTVKGRMRNREEENMIALLFATFSQSYGTPMGLALNQEPPAIVDDKIDK